MTIAQRRPAHCGEVPRPAAWCLRAIQSVVVATGGAPADVCDDLARGALLPAKRNAPDETGRGAWRTGARCPVVLTGAARARAAAGRGVASHAIAHLSRAAAAARSTTSTIYISGYICINCICNQSMGSWRAPRCALLRRRALKWTPCCSLQPRRLSFVSLGRARVAHWARREAHHNAVRALRAATEAPLNCLMNGNLLKDPGRP